MLEAYTEMICVWMVLVTIACIACGQTVAETEDSKALGHCGIHLASIAYGGFEIRYVVLADDFGTRGC